MCLRLISQGHAHLNYPVLAVETWKKYNGGRCFVTYVRQIRRRDGREGKRSGSVRGFSCDIRKTCVVYFSYTVQKQEDHVLQDPLRTPPGGDRISQPNISTTERVRSAKSAFIWKGLVDTFYSGSSLAFAISPKRRKPAVKLGRPPLGVSRGILRTVRPREHL